MDRHYCPAETPQAHGPRRAIDHRAADGIQTTALQLLVRECVVASTAEDPPAAALAIMEQQPMHRERLEDQRSFRASPDWGDAD
jgi:hypothetical protein